MQMNYILRFLIPRLDSIGLSTLVSSDWLPSILNSDRLSLVPLLSFGSGLMDEVTSSSLVL